jgi:ribonuclease HII
MFGVGHLAGVDEVGRGALAGPVVAAAVIFPDGFKSDTLRDSKRLTPHQRQTIGHQIKAEAVAWSIACVSPAVIDQLNILQASLQAMREAVLSLTKRPDLIVVDGRIPISNIKYPQQALIRGDEQVQAVAAASILAKIYRDAIMEQLHEEYPWYDWQSNKGYPTLSHRKGIEAYGHSPYHRLSFRLT